jgi:hypothetical protein
LNSSDLYQATLQGWWTVYWWPSPACMFQSYFQCSMCQKRLTCS